MEDNETIEGEIIEDTSQPTPPEGVVVASNGAWRDAETGRFVQGGPVPQTAITVEKSAEFHSIREQKQLAGMQQAERRLYDVSPEYWGDIAESFYNLALGEKGGIAAVQAGRMVGEMTGYLGSSKDGGSGPAPGRASVTVDLDQDALMEFITSRRQQDTSNQDNIPGGEQQAGASGVAASSQDQVQGDTAEEE